MRQLTASSKSPSISRAITISAVVHFIVLLFIIFLPSGIFMETEPEQEIMWVELPKGTGEDIEAVKEVKRLPETPITEEVKPLKPLPTEKAMQEPKKKKIVEPKKTKIDDALSKIDKKLKEREVAQTKTTGTGFQDGTSDKPLKDENYHSALLKYRALVKAKILRQWIPPSALQNLPANQRPSVKLVVFISKSGDVISTQWAQRSGNEALNQSAVRAIQRASPFPIPPDPLKWEAYKEGFSIVFNPSTR